MPARPEMTPLMQSWSDRFQRETLKALDLRRQDLSRLDDAELRAQVADLVRQLIASTEGFPVSLDEDHLVREVVDRTLGLGPLDELLADPTISEIMINGPSEIWIERHGKLQRSPLRFPGEPDLRRVLDRIVTPLGRRIDEGSPMVDARLPDGSRVNAVLAPLSLRGSALTIRRFTRSLLTVQDLVDRGSASAAMLEFLAVCVESRRNIIISGGTGSGKTTLLNLLSNLIPSGERVLTIEDSAELSLRGDHVLSLEARPPNLEQRGEITIRDLVRNALRMRPDRIVVGECRGAEALDMLQAMNTGHDGSLTTLHANSARDVVSRLEVLALMAGMDLPVLALREQIASAIDLIVHQARFADGRRRITTIAEVTGIESGRIQMQTLFEYQPERGFIACDVVPQFYERLARTGTTLDLSIFSAEAGS
ncbi:MAG: CpaF family protein [Burkholderiaceae bacterium]